MLGYYTMPTGHSVSWHCMANSGRVLQILLRKTSPIPVVLSRIISGYSSTLKRAQVIRSDLPSANENTALARHVVLLFLTK